MQSSSVHPTTRKNYNYEYEHLARGTGHYKIGVAAVRLRKSMCTDTPILIAADCSSVNAIKKEEKIE